MIVQFVNLVAALVAMLLLVGVGLVLLVVLCIPIFALRERRHRRRISAHRGPLPDEVFARFRGAEFDFEVPVAKVRAQREVWPWQ